MVKNREIVVALGQGGLATASTKAYTNTANTQINSWDVVYQLYG